MMHKICHRSRYETKNEVFAYFEVQDIRLLDLHKKATQARMAFLWRFPITYFVIAPPIFEVSLYVIDTASKASISKIGSFEVTLTRSLDWSSESFFPT